MPTANSIPLLPQGTSSPPGKKLLDQMRAAIRTKHYSYRIEQTYVGWIKRFISAAGSQLPGPQSVAQ